MPPSHAAPNGLPLIDFRSFLNGSARDRARVAASIDAGFKSHGFIYLSNHGVDQRKVDECFAWSKRFFDLTESEKTTMQPSPLQRRSHHRGYSGLGSEKVREQACTKEGFGCGNPQDDSQPNIWPPEELLPGFRAFMEDFFQECTILTRHLLDSLSLVLDLSSSESLAGKHIRSAFHFDLLHYPAVPTRHLHSGKLSRIPAHSDFGTLTLLFQDAVGGLEIADLTSATTEKSAEFEKTGSFIPVTPVPGTVVVNVGYLLMRWSNGRWKNTIHRVTGPSCTPTRRDVSNDVGSDLDSDADNQTTTVPDIESQEEMTPERYSIPFCSAPDQETMIEALPGCWSEDEPKRWKPIQAGRYLLRKREAMYT